MGTPKTNYTSYTSTADADENAENADEDAENADEDAESEELDETEERDADYKYLSTERIIGQKIERAVTKGIITQDEADKLDKALKKGMKAKNISYWSCNHYTKTYELCYDIISGMDNNEEIKAIFDKIEKA